MMPRPQCRTASVCYEADRASGAAHHDHFTSRAGCAAAGWDALEHLARRQGDALMEGLVRLLVETSEEAEASRIAELIVDELRDLAGLQEKKVTKYWKIPEYFEVLLVLRVTNSGAWCEKVTGVLGTGWETLRETEAIWNPGEGHSFLVNEARWAQVELVS